MKNINWEVRLKNKVFWTALIPVILLLVQAVASLFGFTLNVIGLETQLLAVVEAVFLLLAILGVVVDPTTSGVKDSKQAMTYREPKKDA